MLKIIGVTWYMHECNIDNACYVTMVAAALLAFAASLTAEHVFRCLLIVN